MVEHECWHIHEHDFYLRLNIDYISHCSCFWQKQRYPYMSKLNEEIKWPLLKVTRFTWTDLHFSMGESHFEDSRGLLQDRIDRKMLSFVKHQNRS